MSRIYFLPYYALVGSQKSAPSAARPIFSLHMSIG